MENAKTPVSLKELTHFLAESLAMHPEQVEVEESVDRNSSVLRLKVAQDDLGRIIGRQGRTARAIRAMLGAAAMKLHRRVMLEILE
jgi:predicted RNA-binding protein YlqC (UPF0109 family)